MRKACVFVHDRLAGQLIEDEAGLRYRFVYLPDYSGPPISLTMPVRGAGYEFTDFPAVFDGLLSEGIMLDGLLRQAKIDRNDRFSQLLAVGHDLVGAVTVFEADSE